MKKMAIFMAVMLLFTSISAYGAADGEPTIIAFSAEPMVGRTIKIITNNEPETVRWKCADSENGVYSVLDGETKETLYVNQNLFGKWIKAEVNGVESESYWEKSAIRLASEDFSSYPDHINQESGNPYYDSPGDGTELSVSFAKQTQGEVVVEFRYKYAGDHGDSLILQLYDKDQKSGSDVYFFNDKIMTWGEQAGGLDFGASSFTPESGDNHDGAWHTMKMIIDLTTKEMELYIDGQSKVSPGLEKWNTKYFKDDFSAVKFNFLRSFSLDDLKIYKPRDNNINEAPYVEGAMRLLSSSAHLDYTIKDYDHDAIVERTFDWYYSDTKDGEYTKIASTGDADIPYNSAYKYIKCVVSARDDLGAVTTVTTGPFRWLENGSNAKNMPYVPAPTISGACMVGETLTGDWLGGWKNPAGEYGVASASSAWYRSDNVNGPWTKIADGGSYTLTDADVGHYITYRSEFRFGMGTAVDADEQIRQRTAQPVFCSEVSLSQHVTGKAAGDKVVVEAENKADTDLSFQLIHAYYQQERLVDVEVFPCLLPHDANYLKQAFPITKSNAECHVKSFILKDFASLKSFGTIDDVKYNNGFLEIKARAADEQKGTTLVGGRASVKKDGYLLFKDIAFTDDVNYVTVKASRRSCDEERYLFRINSPTGDIIADCKVEDTGSLDTFKEFTYDVEVSPGVYDLYVVSEFGNDAYLDSFKFSDRDDSVPEFEVPQANVIDNYHDTWVAVDGAGRAIADYEETGDVRKDKYVAMFYWSWHEDWADKTAPVNVSSILEQHPEIMHDYKSELWPPAPAYFWGEPLFGYYRLDPWVLRKHAQMLANAGVDVVIFDCSNGNSSFETGYSEILKEFSKARADGINAPKVAFMSNFSAREDTATCLTKIYKNMYRDETYKDSWFYWKGKPLVLAYPDSLNNPGEDPEKQKLYEEIKNFFTFREPQSTYDQGPSNNTQWGWLEQYPQHEYVKNEDGSCEQVTAGIAQNFSYVTKSLTAMNDEFAQGRSYTARYGEDLSENAWDYGYNFKEQFEYAIELDPELIFVTGWNEWIAGRFNNWYGIENAFPDQCNYERSRDIEPVKGKYGDNYYYQLVDYIRKFKGTRPVPTASAEKSIDINGSIAQWNDVGPEFINDEGTTIHRDSDGYRGTHYTNETGRNDILLSKVARDKDYIMFYAQTDKTLTSKDDPNWMTLYINADRNHATGWEGYDFVVNRRSPGDKAYLEYNDTGDWEWKALSEVEYSIQDNVLQVKIPRAALGLSGGEMDIEFKWTDNIETAGDPINFWVDGCSAPCGRFNYRYTTKAIVPPDAETKEDLKDKIVIKEGSPNMYVGASKTLLYDADSSAAAFTEGNSIYIPAKAVEKMIYGSKVEIGEKYITIKSDETTLRLYRDQTSRLNGRLLAKPYRVVVRNTVDYVDAELLSDIFGKQLRKEENNIYTFSEDGVRDTTLAFVNEGLR